MIARKGVTAVLAGMLIALGATGSAAALSLFGYNFGSDSSSSSSTSTTEQSGSTLDACLHYSNHVYEVCTAYIVNSSLGALWPYYAYAHSDDPLVAEAASSHFSSRYTGQAYDAITNRVATWPQGDLDASVPNIQIASVSSSLATNTAVLHTVESWQIRTESGRVLYREDDVPHTVTMHRVPSYILHKWIVSDIY